MASLVVVASYLLGALPLGLLVTRRVGVDPRRAGSGNLGATNVYRLAGWRTGLVVMALDLSKGAAAVVLSALTVATEPAMVAAGVAAVTGHVFPVWLRWRGGKGVATACGAFGVLAPAATAGAILVFVVTVWWTRVVSSGSMLATLTLPVWAATTGESAAVVGGATLVAALVLLRHRGNLQRLRQGTEPRLARSTGAGGA